MAYNELNFYVKYFLIGSSLGVFLGVIIAGYDYWNTNNIKNEAYLLEKAALSCNDFNGKYEIICNENYRAARSNDTGKVSLIGVSSKFRTESEMENIDTSITLPSHFFINEK